MSRENSQSIELYCTVYTVPHAGPEYCMWKELADQYSFFFYKTFLESKPQREGCGNLSAPGFTLFRSQQF